MGSCETTTLEKDRSLNEIKDDIDGTYQYSIDNTIPTVEPQTSDDRVVKQTIDVTQETKSTPQPEVTAAKSSTHRTTTKARDKVDPMDQYLLDGLLHIVDEKFETISKRITALERGISNLQYYNVRSFRVVNTHLHAVDTILHGITSEINQVEIKNRELEQGVGSVKNEISDLQTMNNGMFQAIEQNLVHFHKDIRSRLSEVKSDLDISNGQIAEIKNETADIKFGIDALKFNQKEVVTNTEDIGASAVETAHSAGLLVNVTLGILQESADMKTNTDEIKHTVDTISKNLSELTTITEEIKSDIASHQINASLDTKDEDVFSSSGESINEKKNIQELRVQDSEIYMTCSKMFELLDAKMKNIKIHQNSSCTITDSNDFKNDSKTLLRALSVVNENVLQSVTMYRHAGDLFERVISETEFIANEQVKLREDIQDFVANNSMYLEYLAHINETFELSKAGVATTADTPTTTTGTVKDSRCEVSTSILDQVSKMSRNNTELVELLTNLAETSSTALKETLVDLQTEVTKLHKLKSDNTNKHYRRKSFLVHDDPKAGTNNGALKDLQNKTEWVYQLVEAVASNTGWIPYIFHNMRFIESQVNKTLKLSTEISERTEETLLRQRMESKVFNKLTAPTMTPTSQLPNLGKVLGKQILAATVSSIPEATTGAPPSSDSRKHVKSSLLNFNSSTGLGHMMEFVYETNVKIDRLIPALTNLLGEPGKQLCVLSVII